MNYPPQFLRSVISSDSSASGVVDMANPMSLNLLYLFCLLAPLVLVPVLMPVVKLMAQRKRIIDAPNARKVQSSPVAVMGGTVMMLVLSIALIFINLFYDISGIFPVVCVMFVLYIFGLLDDGVGLTWQFKMVMQLIAVMLLFFGGGYGVFSLHGFMGVSDIPYYLSIPISIFCGLLMLNAVNFSDGIDGLASGLAVLACTVMSYWNMRHGFVTETLLSLTMVGVSVSFFFYNTFSRRLKMYMGDSGSLVLGLFMYVSSCSGRHESLAGTFLADDYYVSFLLAVFSAMIFDLVRVVLMRLLHGGSPFEPDRTHLHHVCVDMGLSHFITTLGIILFNLAVVLVWYISASAGLNVTVQLLITVFAAVLLIWGPYFVITSIRNRNPERYAALCKGAESLSVRVKGFEVLVGRFVDGRLRRRRGRVVK